MEDEDLAAFIPVSAESVFTPIMMFRREGKNGSPGFKKLFLLD